MGRIEVVDKKYDKTVRFDALEVGETFRSNTGEIYVKLDLLKAFSFQRGSGSIFFDAAAPVVPVNCKLIVEG